MKVRRILEIYILCLTIFVIRTQRKNQHEKLIENGKFPKAVEKTNKNVLMVYDIGALEFDETAKVVSSSHLPAYLRTDVHSSLFRLNKNKLVLLTESPLKIILFNEDYSNPNTAPYPDYANALSDSYRYSLISDNSFMVSWTGSVSYHLRIFNVDSNGAITEDAKKKDISCSNCQGISCVHYFEKSQHVCAYISPGNIQIDIFRSSDLSLVKSSYLGNGYADTLHLSHFQLNLFAICYNLVITSQCSKIEISSGDIATIIGNPMTLTKAYVQSTNIDTFIFNKISLFTISTDMSVLTLNQFTSNLELIGESETGGGETDVSSPSFFTIGRDVVGYVFKRGTGLIVRTYIFPICDDSKVYSKVVSSLELTVPFTMDGKTPTTDGRVIFYQLPRNALFRSNDDFVFEGKEYNILTNSFKLITFEPGSLDISYTGLAGRYGTNICKIKVIVCYITCLSCTDSPPTESNHQCIACAQNFYFKENYNDICYNNDTIPSDYYLNAGRYSKCDASCSTCVTLASYCLQCAPNYYFIEGTSTCILKAPVPVSFYFDEFNQIFRQCYTSCKTCFGHGTDQKNNCIDCLEPFEKNNDYDRTSCGQNCTLRWTYELSTNKITCVNTEACATPYLYYIQLNKQCVTSCNPYLPNSDCALCQTKRLLLNKDSMECVEKCPEGKKTDYRTNKCLNPNDPPDPDDPDPDPEPPDPLPDPDPDNKGKRIKVYQQANDSTKKIAQFVLSNYYINDYFKRLGELMTLHKTEVDLIFHFIAGDYTYTIFRLSDNFIYRNVYDSQGVAAIDFSSIQSKLFGLNSITNADDVFVMQWDIERVNELTNQTEDVLYNSKGSKLDVSGILNETIMISYPIRKIEDPYLARSIEMKAKGIDIYNRSSPFFNDVCFKFTNERERDMTIPDRREYYYPSNEICQDKCQYVSFNPSKEIKCNCTYLESYTFVDTVRANPKAAEFPDKDYQPYNSLACPYAVFTPNDIINNISFWLFLAFLIAMIILTFCFICSGLTYASKYISDVLKPHQTPQAQAGKTLLPSNPPKSIGRKSTSRSVDKSVHTKIEEEVFGDVANNNNKANPLRQNYIKCLETNTSGKDEKTIINKLKNELDGNNKLPSNVNFESYYFTRNSDNQSNPMYSKKGTVDQLINSETGRSFTSSNIKKKMNNELYHFNDDGNEEDDNDNEKEEEEEQNDFEEGKSSNVRLKVDQSDRKRATYNKNVLRKRDNENEEDKDSTPKHKTKSNTILLSNSQTHPMKFNLQKSLADESKKGMSASANFPNNKSNYKKDQNEMIPEASRTEALIRDNYSHSAFPLDLKSENDVVNSYNALNKVKEQKNDSHEVKAVEQYSFCRSYFNYCKKREIFFITFCSNKTYLPFFITLPIFLFCCTIVFTIHALFFTNDFIHLRFIEAGDIDVAYWFKNEFLKCFYVALVSNVVKIIIVKLLVFLVFRIEKKMLSKQNHNVILQRLKCKSTAIFVVLICLMGALFYINTCYSGIYPNTESGLFIGFAVSIVLSFLIAMLLCFVINIIRLIGISCNCS